MSEFCLDLDFLCLHGEKEEPSAFFDIQKSCSLMYFFSVDDYCSPKLLTVFKFRGYQEVEMPSFQHT